MTSPGGSLTERLQLVVDATTSSAEAKFSRLTGVARETGDTASRSADSVRDAADRVAGALDRQLTAAGNLRVAETRLAQLRDSGRARADQIAAAEERVAGAQRNLQLAVRNTARATEEQTEAQQQATTQMTEGTDSGGRLSGVMDQLKARAIGAAAAMGGAGLLSILRGVGEGFAAGARDAGNLANSMNATVEEAGAFLGLVGALGLELNDLLEIQAEFAQKVDQNASDFQELGAQTQRNADGTVNWANTLVDFLEKLQGVEDATERNRLGFQFLGEEGYKQMSQLVNSGTSVRDALEKIGVPFTQEDVDAAAAYDTAMLDLTLTSQRAQQQLGRVLLPILAGIAEGFGDLADIASAIPGPLAIATIAAITLGLTGFAPSAVIGARLATVMAVVNREVALFGAAAATSGVGAAVLTTGMAGASAAGAGLAGLLGGPLGIGLVVTAGAWALASNGADDFQESARKAAEELAAAKDSADEATVSIEDMAKRLAGDAGFWESYAASVRGANEAFGDDGGFWSWDPDPAGVGAFVDTVGDGELAAIGFEAQIREAGDALGSFGSQQATAQITSKALNDLIAEGTTSGSEFADAVQKAAEAEAAQSRTSDLAAAALAAYNATTRDAVQTQLDLYSATLAQSDGLIGLQQAVHDASEVVDDASTPWNEVAEATNRVIAATLSYAGTAADAAVAAARANGTVVDSITEAQLRADATIAALRESLNAPGLTDLARDQIGSMIQELQTAQESGDIEAVLRLTGAEETTSELDDATQDRDAVVRVESRGGPAVVAYLDRVTADRLAIIRVESRNGPAVDEYLDRLALERLAIIRVESRNGPAVDEYLDRLAEQARTAYIDVRQRSGAGSPTLRNAPGAGQLQGGAAGGSVTVGQLTVVAQTDSGGRLSPGAMQVTGRQIVSQLREYTRQNGSGWTQGLLK